ncbi:MAG: HDOD domain-containing protein [Archangium sp.]|nr:HDOD domain-containing protein [Archangium sp.]
MQNKALNYGRGEYELPSDTVDVEATRIELTQWLDGFLARPTCELPRPPQVALEVLALSKKPNARIEDIASVLEREPLLAGRVLKLANSALYGGGVACVTLKQALVRMGLAIVRDVVMEAAMQMTVIHAEGLNATLESIRRHSSAVAWISRFVARNTSIDAENAFLVGLLHDVGMSYALIALAEFARIHRKPARLDAASWLAVESVHERFSEHVLSSWGLPPSVSIVPGHHHTLMMGGRPHPQVAVLIVAEQLAADAKWNVRPVVEQGDDGIAFSPGAESSSRDETERALKVLDLTQRHYELVQKDTQRVLETLAGQFKTK